MRPKIIDRYRHKPQAAQEFCFGLATAALLVTNLPILKPSRSTYRRDDRRDRAGDLVTGDRRHLIVLHHYEGICIMSLWVFPSEFTSDQARLDRWQGRGLG